MSQHYTIISADCHAGGSHEMYREYLDAAYLEDDAVGLDRFLWGSDYPHDEGTFPYTREHLRQLFHATPPDELQQMLGGNAARVYGFDLEALAPLAERAGPTVGELARPLDRLPDRPNEALLKAAGISGR